VRPAAVPPGSPRTGVRERIATLSPARRGALIFLGSGLVFAGTDALTKSLVSNIPVVDVIFGRHLTYLIALVLLAGRTRPRRLLVTRQPWTQLARGLTAFGAAASFFLSLSLLPLAVVSTLASTTPLWIVALAGPLLGERIQRAAVLGTVVGFGGVIAMIGIDAGSFDAALLVPLATALSYALFSMLTRKLRTDDPDVTMFYSGLVGLVAATCLFVVVPAGPALEIGQWLAIGAVGLSALLAHRILVAAYRWGRASDLAPLGYVNLIWSFIIGAVVFNEPVQAREVIGAVAIATGGAIALRASSDDEEPASTSADLGELADLEPEPRRTAAERST
jgi:drug/metabolite transporter (DMT)-like permease